MKTIQIHIVNKYMPSAKFHFKKSLEGIIPKCGTRNGDYIESCGTECCITDYTMDYLGENRVISNISSVSSGSSPCSSEGQLCLDLCSSMEIPENTSYSETYGFENLCPGTGNWIASQNHVVTRTYPQISTSWLYKNNYNNKEIVVTGVKVDNENGYTDLEIIQKAYLDAIKQYYLDHENSEFTINVKVAQCWKRYNNYILPCSDNCCSIQIPYIEENGNIRVNGPIYYYPVPCTTSCPNLPCNVACCGDILNYIVNYSSAFKVNANENIPYQQPVVEVKDNQIEFKPISISNLQINIYNIVGELIKTFELEGGSYFLNIADYTAGTYFYEYKLPNGDTFRNKFVIIR